MAFDSKNYASEDALKKSIDLTKTALRGKVDKVDGKQLSTEDYTSAEKSKLAGIADNANNYSLPPATSNSLGGVVIGSGLSVDSNGALSVDVDNALDTTSTNPVQNKVVAQIIGDINSVLEEVL